MACENLQSWRVNKDSDLRPLIQKRGLTIITCVDPYTRKITKYVDHPKHVEVRDLFESVRQIQALPIIRVHHVLHKDEIALVEKRLNHLAVFQIAEEQGGPIGCQFLLLFGENTLTNQFIDAV